MGWTAAAVVASTAISAVGQKNAAKAQASAEVAQGELLKKQAEYNATSTENVAKYNTDVLEQTAQRNIAVIDAQSKYAQAVAEQNAKVFDLAAQDAVARGVDSASEERLQAKRINAKGRAAAGSSGTVIDAGTNLQLSVQNAGTGEINALTVMNNAEREAYGYKVQARDVRESARGSVYDSAIAKENIRYTTDLEKQGVKYQSDVDAANTRLSGQLGLINAQNSAKVTSYAGRLNALSTLVDGGSRLAKVKGW